MTIRKLEEPWRFYVEPFCVYGNLYSVGNRGVCSWLIDTGDGLILIDTTFPQTVYQTVDSIYRLGFAPADIRYVLHTHGHCDHMGGSRSMRDLTQATFCIGAEDVDVCEHRGEMSEAELYDMNFTAYFTVDKALRDGDTLTLGNTEVLCVHTPGHTPGTMSYFFDITGEQGSFRVGMQGGPGIHTLVDDYLAAHDLPKSLRASYIESVARLRQERVDIHLTGHPGQSRIFPRKATLDEGDSLAFVDPGRWPKYLDYLESCFRDEYPA
ncbi:MAG TPA: MBL fold metallo-hydrolase [Myxococcales bacterium]|nr:MBL fold metallo-hydrolase [Myxococcales bacterium]